jgi:methylated-DNA-[protein]-cysteine S-methyltransferase
MDVCQVQTAHEGMIMSAISEAPVPTQATGHTTIGSSLGELTIVTREGAVTGLYFPHHWHLPDRGGFGQYREEGFDDIRKQLGEYLSGTRRDFDVLFDAVGSPLQRRVWDLVSRVPYGKTTSYGELARELGGGITAQEVGAAVGLNPVCLLIPCHRVVGANGSLTGYAGGLRRKRALLDLEQQVAGPSARLF